MRYPNPKTILLDLAEQPATYQEALRLLTLPSVPASWPACPKKSRNYVLRRLACNSEAPAKTRLACISEQCFGITLDQQRIISTIKTRQRKKESQTMTDPNDELRNLLSNPSVPPEVRKALDGSHTVPKDSEKAEKMHACYIRTVSAWPIFDRRQPRGF